MENPGAGSYHPQPLYKRNGQTIFGRENKRAIFDERKAKFVPSPNAYQ